MSSPPVTRIVGFQSTVGFHCRDDSDTAASSPLSSGSPSETYYDTTHPGCCEQGQSLSPSFSTSSSSSARISPRPVPVSLLRQRLESSEYESVSVLGKASQQSAPLADGSQLKVLCSRANKPHLPAPSAAQQRARIEDMAAPLERSHSTSSIPISIPARQQVLHASAAGNRGSSSDGTRRVLRRVPEPPIMPAAITAPAVVQLLLAAQAAKAAERLRQELAYHCDRNNLKHAYVCQEQRRVLEAHAQRLEAEGAPQHTTVTTNAASQKKIHLGVGKVDWEGWYDLPHGNIAAAEYCAGEAEKALARML